jgi:hypothetical protein
MKLVLLNPWPSRIPVRVVKTDDTYSLTWTGSPMSGPKHLTIFGEGHHSAVHECCQSDLPPFLRPRLLTLHLGQFWGAGQVRFEGTGQTCQHDSNDSISGLGSG